MLELPVGTAASAAASTWTCSSVHCSKIMINRFSDNVETE